MSCRRTEPSPPRANRASSQPRRDHSPYRTRPNSARHIRVTEPDIETQPAADVFAGPAAKDAEGPAHRLCSRQTGPYLPLTYLIPYSSQPSTHQPVVTAKMCMAESFESTELLTYGNVIEASVFDESRASVVLYTYIVMACDPPDLLLR